MSHDPQSIAPAGQMACMGNIPSVSSAIVAVRATEAEPAVFLLGQLQEKLHALRAASDAATAAVEAQQRQFEIEGFSGPGSTERWAPWSSTRPPALPVPPFILEDATGVQDLLDAHMRGLGEVEVVMSELNELVASTKGQVAATQRLCQLQSGLLRSQSNRWHNQQGASPLLRLPVELLRAIACLDARRELRTACVALRHACGSPGRTICISGAPNCPVDQVATRIRSWPWPESIRMLYAYTPVLRSAFTAACETFANLQELTLPTGSHPFSALPPTLTSLETVYTPNNPDKAPLDLGTITHLTALRSLSVMYHAALPMDFTPLQALVALTHLELGQDDPDMDEQDFAALRDSWPHPPVRPLLSTLSHLPALSSFNLWLGLDWRGGEGGAAGEVAGGGILRALTRLDLLCFEAMDSDDAALQVGSMFRSMPALRRLLLKSADLLLWDGMAEEVAGPLLQVLQERSLELLHVQAFSAMGLNLGLVGQLAPTLTSLTCTFQHGQVSSDSIGEMLLTPTSLLTLRLEGFIALQAAQGIITLLAEHAPQLRELELSSTLGQDAAPEPQAIQLSVLTNLQTLCLSGRLLVDALAHLLASTPPAPPALPTLTKLCLPDAYLPLQPSALAALTQLTHLELGARCCCITTAGGLCDASYLPAIKQMCSLAKLVLDVPEMSITEQELNEMVPPPASLQSLAIKHTTEALEKLVMRVLGRYVKNIDLMPRLDSAGLMER